MSRAPLVQAKRETPYARAPQLYDTTLGWRFVNPRLEQAYGVDTMGETAENVAAEHGITRTDQDAFAVRSQARAAKAQAAGRLAREIVPVSVPQSRGEPAIMDADEHPRETSVEALGKLRPAFGDGGSVTAGNSSARSSSGRQRRRAGFRVGIVRA